MKPAGMVKRAMTSLFVAFYRAYPPDSGAAAVSYYTAKYFPGEKTFKFIDKTSYELQLDGQLKVATFACSTKSPIRKAWGIFRSLPYLVRTIRIMKPTWIFLEGASWTGYFVPLMFLLRMYKIPSRIIYHAHNVEVILRKEKNDSLLAWITGFTEKYVVRHSQIVTAVSDVDIRNFQSLYGISPFPLPNGVDLQQYRVSRSETGKIKRKYGLGGELILFMGLPEYKPNKEAIHFLLEEVFPKLLRIRPKVKLALIGGKIGKSYPWLINPGSIPFSEVAAFILNCTVCVAPIFSGSGTRLKILEYMAARKPVVATAKGAEGLRVENSRSILLAESAVDFSSQIMTLLRDTPLRTRLGEQGYRVVKAFYSWPNILQQFSQKLPPIAHKNRGQRTG